MTVSPEEKTRFERAHVDAVALLLLVHLSPWLLCRFRPLPRRWLVCLDVGNSLAVGVAYGQILLSHPAPPLAPLEGVFAITAVLGVRALMVPIAIALSSVASTIQYGLRRPVKNALRLGRYTLLDELGRGGMGVVYRAQHALLRRPTAVKLLPDAQSSERVTRFEREVQLMAELTTPSPRHQGSAGTSTRRRPRGGNPVVSRQES